jgi:hypothetical protein
MTHRERREFEIREPYVGYEQNQLNGFAGDVAAEVSGLMEDTEVRNVRIVVEWEGNY